MDRGKGKYSIATPMSAINAHEHRHPFHSLREFPTFSLTWISKGRDSGLAGLGAKPNAYLYGAEPEA